MAIKKDVIKSLLKNMKVGKKGDDGKYTVYTDAEIDALLEGSEEKDIVLLEGLKIFTPEEYTQLETNLKDAGKGGYTKAGKEIVIKELKEKIGLDYDGKDPDVFIEKAKEHFIIEAKIPANEAKVQWDKDKAALQAQVTEWKGKFEGETVAKKAIERDATLLRKFPVDRSKSFSDEDLLTLVKTRIEIKEEDGKEVVYYKGQKLQDSLTNPLSIDAALSEVFKAEKWIGEAAAGGAGGRGGGNNNPGGGTPGSFKSLKEVNEYIVQQGYHPGSEKASQVLQEAMQKNPTLDLKVV